MGTAEEPRESANENPREKDQTNGDTNRTPPQVNGLKHHEGERQERREKEEKDSGKDDKDGKDGKEEKQPAGGFDSTKIPRREPGYTLRITFHRATNLPMADYASWSSDPYILAQIYTGLPTRHKEDPPFCFRSPTIRRSTEPEWNCEWIVANIPATGFRMKARIYDEDPSDHDDRLGNAHITVSSLSGNWAGIQNKAYNIQKRSGSKRAYLVRVLAACLEKSKHLNGQLYVSIEMLGRTETHNGGRVYTVGPMWYTKHYSPLLGRIAGRKEPEKEDGRAQAPSKKHEVQKYNFQANQYQLHGPVPAELYHRFVEFKPWVKLMFTTSGIRGWFLSKALHHQHNRVYNFSSTTEYGVIGEEPSKASTLKFLDLVHYDEGGRIFTYVLTLDGLFRFTETGKEFGIDMLSKHTMHSNVSIYIAFSGEFFIRRLKHKHHPPPPDAPPDDADQHPPEDISGGPPGTDSPKDPAQYELVIDNDSGTYRPKAELLPLLKDFLAFNFPGLHILTLDCNKDAERQQRMKKEQVERKKKEGDRIIYRQASRSSSISSSDVSDLEGVEAGMNAEAREPGILKTVGRDAKQRGSQKRHYWKSIARGRSGPAGQTASSHEDGANAAAGAEQSGA